MMMMFDVFTRILFHCSIAYSPRTSVTATAAS